MYQQIKKCRLCGNEDLVDVLSLGNQSLTGVFPNLTDQQITCGPLELVKCHGEVVGKNECGLVQLKHTYDHEEMYGDNYGYRSSLNNSMIRNLNDIKKLVERFLTLENSDLIVDIGSNDGTFLNFFDSQKYRLCGIDPTAKKFSHYYHDGIKILPEFFNSELVRKHFGDQKAKIVASIAMFYDLDNPLDFTFEVAKILDPLNGIWVLEQSYFPLMIAHNSYDTVCHEHLEYYCLQQIKWCLDKAGLKIIHIELNDTNGGSIRLLVTHSASNWPECHELLNILLEQEQKYNQLKTFEEFRIRVSKHRQDLTDLLKNLKLNGKKIFGYGASTKGNVLLQYCNITRDDLPFIVEVNPDKFGCFTPQTNIPIIDEASALKLQPDYYLVLPWHFKDSILNKEAEARRRGIKFIFPLPNIEII